MSLVWRDRGSTKSRNSKAKCRGTRYGTKSAPAQVLANQRKAARVVPKQKRRNAADEATITMIPHLRWLSWHYVVINKGAK